MDKTTLFLNNLPRVLSETGGGYADPPDTLVISNAESFIRSLPTYYQKMLDPENCITATPHGTITIDWYYRKNFVSVEVGKSLTGWFSDLPDGSNLSSDGISCQEAIPQIIKALNKLYSRTDTF